MTDFLIIIRRNFLSPIVIAIFILALTLFLLNERRDALFLSSVITINTIIGVVQEIRARLALRKLELMNAPMAHLINNDGSLHDIMFDELLINNRVMLKLGDEVPADGIIEKSDGLELDESMLTGESAPIEKSKGTIAYAASSVVAGSAEMRVTAIGETTKVGIMSSTLKRYRPQLTPLQKAIWRAITFLTYGALFLAVLIFVVYYSSGQDAIKIFKTITSAAVTIVPEGLLLASSLLLAFGSLRLAQAKVLPQKLAAIEAMALLNVLCVDKTGTLTSDEISFESFEKFNTCNVPIHELVGIIAKETSSGSTTGDAVIQGMPAPNQYEVLEVLAFSSSRKLSGVKTKFGGKNYSVIMGAPEFVSKKALLSSDQQTKIKHLTSVGKRVLLVAVFKNTKTSLRDLPDNSGIAAGILVLTNELREGVKKTVSYLQQKGVSIKVISGDNPNTVGYIASMAGINDYQKVITGSELEKVGKNDWDEVVAKTTIFARVFPEQKERLIGTFRKKKLFTGMVGDGVNDALAIKKANLGIAMYSGAVATRRVADIVLLNNSFNSLPMGMKLGNRIIQAIEVIATLFFHKIIYGVILLLSTLVLGIVFPFEPRHITFMNIFMVTLPTIMWTLFTPVPMHRISPNYFWRDTLFAVAPIAVLSGALVTTVYTVLHSVYPNDLSGVATSTVLIATLFGVYLVFLMPHMFDLKNDKKAQFARGFYVLTVLFVMIPSLGLSSLRGFFDFTAPAWRDTWQLVFLIFGVAIIQWWLAVSAGKRFKQREP